jgi:hypothetical protein
MSQADFLIKSFGDIIEKSSNEEIVSLTAEFLAVMLQRGDRVGLERYNLILKGIVMEIDRELEALDTDKNPAEDSIIEMSAQFGTTCLKALRETIVDAIDVTNNF